MLSSCVHTFLKNVWYLTRYYLFYKIYRVFVQNRYLMWFIKQKTIKRTNRKKKKKKIKIHNWKISFFLFLCRYIYILHKRECIIKIVHNVESHFTYGPIYSIACLKCIKKKKKGLWKGTMARRTISIHSA